MECTTTTKFHGCCLRDFINTSFIPYLPFILNNIIGETDRMVWKLKPRLFSTELAGFAPNRFKIW